MIELKKLKVYTTEYDYKVRSYVMQKEPKEMFYVDKSELDDAKKTIKLQKTSPFLEGKSVYFEKNVIFPRKDFRDSYPNNKVVLDPKRAEIIIVDINKMLSRFNSMYNRTYYEYNDGWTLNSALRTGNNEVQISSTWHYANNELEQLLNEFNDILTAISKGECKFVDVKSIPIKSEVYLEEGTFNTINTLLKSGIDENVCLGVNMLCNTDFEKSHAEIAILMHNNLTFWQRVRKKKVNVKLRNFFDRLNEKYPGAMSLGSNLTFNINLALQNPHNPMVAKEFSDWMKSQAGIKVEGDIKISLENVKFADGEEETEE